MVTMEGRVFGRSYYLAERSWYTTFMGGEVGSLRCGKMEIPVTGTEPKDLAIITRSINEAYSKKYGSKSYNQKWIDGLAEPERVARTMEFVPA